MAAATTMAIIGASLLVAKTGYDIYSSERARSESNKAADEQEREQKRLLEEAEAKKKADEQGAERDRKRAMQRQGQVSSQAANKGGTILTSPLGSGSILGGGSGKSLLGV